MTPGRHSLRAVRRAANRPGRAGSSRMIAAVEFIRRFLTVGVLSLWFGGFTFYSAVVIHVGHRVLGRVEQGFVTQRVTNWLNLIALIALAVLAWNAAAGWRRTGRRLRLTLSATLAIMVAAQAVLFAMHPKLDRMLDAERHEITERRPFRSMHKAYLNTATVQWAATIAHIAALLLAWREADRLAGVPVEPPKD